MVFVGVAALVVGACGSDASSTTTTTVAPPTTTTAAAPATTTAAPVVTTTTTSPATTTTEVPAGAEIPAGAMLITNEDGVFVATLQGNTSQVIAASPGSVGGLIAFAIDDTAGGVVFQPNRGPWTYQGADSIVYWVKQGSGAAQELLVPGAEQGLSLEDVAREDGSTMVYYTRVEGRDSPDTASQTLRRFDVTAKTVDELARVGGWESGSSPISVGGESIVSNGTGEGLSWISFMDHDGAPFESPANPMADGAFDCLPECLYYADLSPDGTHVAFGRLTPNAAGSWTIPEVEVRNVASGAVVMSVTLPEIPAVAWIDSLDLIEDFVLINLVEEGSEYPVAMILQVGPGEATGYFPPIGGVARFLRSMPELDGVVAWP